MAKPTGFLEFERQEPLERDLQERVGDWIELYVHQPEEKLKAQGARCMDCGVPFCHTGRMLNGMASGCPINNLIPEWNDLVYRGLWREAYERLNKTNNFPEFTGRTCPAPCEAACVLGINNPAVTIKSIENAIIDRAFENGWVQPNRPAKRTGKKVAIVGSGPAGLACADQLNKVGHSITVFERDDRAGGLMMYGIPNMKIDKKLVQRRIDVLQAAGIEFVLNCEIGVDISAAQLQQRFDAVVLCTGAKQARDMALPGRELQGIQFAMDFLSQNTKSLLDSELADGHYISAAERKVVVIGGGDTGTDCVATALRHGCSTLTQLEIMEQPPLQRAADNPWPQWPRVYVLDYGQKEAKARFGSDPRRYATMTKAFLGDENGRVRALQTVDVEWHGYNGSRQLIEVAGSEREIEADLVILALGFSGPESGPLADFGVVQDRRSNIDAPYGNFETSVSNVFAAGDARRGQSLVVWAINEGRAVARAIDTKLMGDSDLP